MDTVKQPYLKLFMLLQLKIWLSSFNYRLQEIALTQEETVIRLSKTEHDTIEIHSRNKKPITLKKESIVPKEIRRLLENSPYRQIDENRWHDRRTGTIYTTENLINQLIENDPEIQAK